MVVVVDAKAKEEEEEDRKVFLSNIVSLYSPLVFWLDLKGDDFIIPEGVLLVIKVMTVETSPDVFLFPSLSLLFLSSIHLFSSPPSH